MLRRAIPGLVPVLAVAGAVAATVVTLSGSGPGSSEDARTAPTFLTKALGQVAPDAPLAREPVPGVTTAITKHGYSIAARSSSLGVDSLNASGDSWRRFAQGVTRPTLFGQETVKFGRFKVEQFSTVESHQGVRTWRWKLGTRNLQPQLRSDGSVELTLPSGILGLRILPVTIFNEHGRNVTPENLSWSLRKSETSAFLELRLDDSKLPLPYVIDPSATYGGSVGTGSSNVNQTPAHADITTTAGVPVGATLFVTGAEATATTTGTWAASDTHSNTYTLDQGDSNSNGVRMGILRSSVTTAINSGDTLSVTAPVGGSANRATSAFYFTGVIAASPFDKSGTATGASLSPSVSTSAATTQAN